MHQVQLIKVDVVNSQKFWTNLLAKPYMFLLRKNEKKKSQRKKLTRRGSKIINFAGHRR